MSVEVKFDEKKFKDYDAFDPNTWKRVVDYFANLFGLNLNDLHQDWDTGGWEIQIPTSTIDKYRKLCEKFKFTLWQDLTFPATTDGYEIQNIIYVGFISDNQPFFISIDTNGDKTTLYFGGCYDENDEILRYYDKGVRYLSLQAYILFSYIGNQLIFEYHTDSKDNLIKEAANQFNKDADKIEVYNAHTGQEVRLNRDEVESD